MLSLPLAMLFSGLSLLMAGDLNEGVLFTPVLLNAEVLFVPLLLNGEVVLTPVLLNEGVLLTPVLLCQGRSGLFSAFALLNPPLNLFFGSVSGFFCSQGLFGTGADELLTFAWFF